MLVLSRRPSEQIIINDNIVITVVSMKGDRIRIGIEAPKGIPIHRAEIHDKATIIDMNLPHDVVHSGDTGKHHHTQVIPSMDLVEAGSF